ncbi:MULTISPECIES: hypothetical protein [unclassified Streptomyces]|uniref:hypothetical protein n=1 Tax=unclassified Streptomyces TaxID=2593676 RepID=UPI0023662526|nr:MULTISPECIES: hypothetical protein [unclassified Streptomyces]MDF3142092.1 hypothetical protein [Streptomyces sp. T21Q-yed]WDF45004.1 hypothetical protein PBV52_42750 [Streptomyces sp. T12]
MVVDGHLGHARLSGDGVHATPKPSRRKRSRAARTTACSVYLQHVRGFSALKTGLLFLPVAVGGMAIAAAGSATLTRLSADGGVYSGLLPGFVVASFGLGTVFVTATTIALGMVDHHEAGLASGVVNTFHEVGGSIGVAVVSTVARKKAHAWAKYPGGVYGS